MSAADIPRDEVASAVAVRHELGKEYEAEVIEAFAERLEKTIDARIESRLGQQQPLVVRGRPRDPTVGIALGSIALGFPITGVAMQGGGAGVSPRRCGLHSLVSSFLCRTVSRDSVL